MSSRRRGTIIFFLVVYIIIIGIALSGHPRKRPSPCNCGDICKNAVTPCGLEECPK